MKPSIGKSALKLIHSAIDSLFERLRLQILGNKAPMPGKRLYFAYKPALTLTSIYNSASEEEGVKPHEDTRNHLLAISESYLDAAQAKARAKVSNTIQTYLSEVDKSKKTDVKSDLGGQLAEVMADVHKDIKRIIETESTIHRNTALSDGIGRNAAAVGVEDPVVFFVVVRDNSLCGSCLSLHMLPNGTTPRVWKMSELQSGYWKRGSDTPSVCGLHPHCRCTLTSLYPGYGFNASGHVTYISPGYSEFNAQRGLTKEPLQKGLRQPQIKTILKQFGWQEKAGGGHDMMEHPAIGAKIPFQRGYSGDYDWQWVDKHLGEAGLTRSRTGSVVADPSHSYFQHYVSSGHAKPTTPQVKSWSPKTDSQSVPIENVELGDTPDGKAHADSVGHMKAGNTQDLPPIQVMDLGGGKFGSLNNHHLLQAAKDTGMTHVPVELIKSQKVP
jgi:hypothetical protein